MSILKPGKDTVKYITCSDDLGFEVVCRENDCRVEVWYPSYNEPPPVLEIGLMHVRAADAIRVEYDLHRDGWRILQASTFEWGEDDETDCDSDWQEVAFIQAWAREKKVAK